MKRNSRAQIAEQTVAIVAQRSYVRADGETVHLEPHLGDCLAGTRFFDPRQLDRVGNKVLVGPAADEPASIEARNETTLAGIARLLADGAGPVAALNFASAKNPGGGFLGGAQAQEESLARNSALYASLQQAPEYYRRHRAGDSALYSDAMILSPGCPVFRDDDGRLLDEPLLATFITSAAPNAGAVARNSPDELSRIPDVFRRRAELVLALAADHGHPALVLGAWGCGVFRNDPELVAGVFAELLAAGWTRRFRRIVFSVLDTSAGQATFDAFRRALGIAADQPGA
jgi:uncharacterized protein (TIGR02452 family)